MDSSAGMNGQLGHARLHGHAHGSEVTPERDSSGNLAPKRARRRLETEGSDDSDHTRGYTWGAGGHGTRHEGTGDRQRDSKPTKAQLVSESVIELLHVCTLIQVALNNNPSEEGIDVRPSNAPEPPQPSPDTPGDSNHEMGGE
ncbi:unnamed protein product [Ectocarpus sp. CCAP 1310/34]|nr:unnamed protein product [Ectocarpus sp. CCAP 1310/34]